MEPIILAQNFTINDFEQLPFYYRAHYKTIRLANRINGIVGPRGVGKTTFLLKTAIERGAKQGKALYVSADNLFFLDNKLVDLAKWVYTETDIETLCIDEIHKYPNWNQELKNIYDMYARLTIIFTGSSMIDIVRSKYDLSRRVTLYPMQGFSFREFLEYYHDSTIPALSLSDITDNHIDLANRYGSDKLLKLFKDYLRMGYYPFTKQLSFDFERCQAIENMIQKTIYVDIALLHNLKTSSLATIEKLFKYVVSSPAGELNTNRLANRLQKDFNDVSKYLGYLNEAGLINLLYHKQTGKSTLGTPDKLLPDNANMIFAYAMSQPLDNIIGKARETFFVNQCLNAGLAVQYSKIGDYQVENYHFEIGGKNKTRKQLGDTPNSYVLSDNKLVGWKKTIPLYLLGFLY